MKSYKRIVQAKYPGARCEASERNFTLIYEVEIGKKFIACGTSASNAWKNAAIKFRLISKDGERL